MTCKGFFTLLVFFLLFSACKQPGTYKLDGEFTVKDPTPVKLYLLGETGGQLVDSTQAFENSFQLEGAVSSPGIYQLKFFNDQSIFLVILPGDRIKLTIDNKFSYISYYVENSFESKRVKEIMDAQNHVFRQIDQLSHEWETNRADSLQRWEIDSAYMSIMRKHKDFTRNFIHEYPGSLANIMAIYQNFGRKTQPLFDPYDDFSLFRFVDSCLVVNYPTAAPVIALNKEVNQIKDELKLKKYIKKIVEAGQPLPSLHHATITGDTLHIDEQTGKPVLLLFWASWNPYSVEELLILNEFARTPASRDYIILGISLDSSEEKLSAFLTSHEIRFPIICDYAYWDSELVARYAIKQVPSTLVSNKEGLILAKDVFGQELFNP